MNPHEISQNHCSQFRTITAIFEHSVKKELKINKNFPKPYCGMIQI